MRRLSYVIAAIFAIFLAGNAGAKVIPALADANVFVTTVFDESNNQVASSKVVKIVDVVNNKKIVCYGISGTNSGDAPSLTCLDLGSAK